MTSWRNWSGRVRCRPARIMAPATEAELASLLQEADPRSGPVRVAGSGHSFTPLVATDGTMVSLRDLSGIVDHDDATGEATVYAGTTIHDLGPMLADLGLALENQGDIDAQAIAGAVGTGTHGTGADLGSVSTQVSGLRLIGAAGESIDCSATERPDLFNAARVSFGSLGVLSRLRLKLRPSYRLREKRWNLLFDEALERLDELAAASRHFEFFWFVYGDVVQVKTLEPTGDDTTPEGFSDWLNEMVLENGALWLFSNLCRFIPWLCEPLGRLSGKLGPVSTRVGQSHRIFPSRRLVRFNEMEYAVPRAALPDALREIAAFVRSKRIAVYFPIECRMVAADDIWLSPFYGRDSATIAVHRYAPTDYQIYFDGVEAIFRNHAGRPHWGKLHTLKAGDLAALYPQWQAFCDLRKEMDPSGLFLNPHLRDLFGVQS